MSEFMSALSAFASKTKLSDIAMGFIFLLVGYLLMPEIWTEWLTSKTPAVFPFGLTLKDLAVFAFTLVGILTYRRAREFLSSKPWENKNLTTNQIDEIFFSDLNDFERSALLTIVAGKFNHQLTDDFRVKVAINRLKNLGLIERMMYVYEAKPAVRDYILSNVREDPEFQKSLTQTEDFNPFSERPRRERY